MGPPRLSCLLEGSRAVGTAGKSPWLGRQTMTRTERLLVPGEEEEVRTGLGYAELERAWESPQQVSRVQAPDGRTRSPGFCRETPCEPGGPHSCH